MSISAAVNIQRRASVYSGVGMSEKTMELAEYAKSLNKGETKFGEEKRNPEDGDQKTRKKVTAHSIGEVISYASLKNYDRKVRYLNNLNLGLAVFALVCFLTAIWLGFDKKKCFEDFDPTTAVIIAGSPIDQRLKDFCIVQSSKTNLIKLLITIVTGLQIGLLFYYYRFQIKSERNAFWYLADSILWRQYYKWFFALEVFVLLPHPFPTGDKVFYDDKLGALMFVRLYLALRVLRDHSEIYRRRLQLISDPSLKKTGAVEFNWLLCVKFLFLEYTWLFVIIGVLLCWFIMAYVIWIFEREQNPLFTIQISLWMTCITMATVGYGDVVPTGNNSKVAAGVAAVFGITLAALLCFAVMSSLTLSAQDTRVRNLWTKKISYDQQKVAAARYIRFMWEHHVQKKDMDENSREYRKMIKIHNAKNSQMKNDLLKFRRELSMAMELDDLVIDRLEEKMDDMTGSIAERLSFRLGLVKDKRKRPLVTSYELKEKVDKMCDEQKRTLAKIDHILQTIISSNSGIVGKIFS